MRQRRSTMMADSSSADIYKYANRLLEGLAMSEDAGDV